MSNKLGDYIEFKNGLNYDKTHKGNGCKIVGVANFKNNLHINFENLDEVKSDIVSDDMLLKNDDLLFVRSNGNKSLVGRCLFVSDLQEKMSFSGFTIRARIKNKQKLLPKYFLYYATAPNFKNSLYKKIGGGTNIRNLTQAVLEDINIELPELDNQKKIANCLDQITQKIQLNNKINDELEKLAKTLYEYWFVQFDFPDENNRPYKSSGGKMVYDEKYNKIIPIGWKIQNLNKNDLTQIIQPSIDKFENEKIYLPTANIQDDKIVDFSNKITFENRESRANMQPKSNSVWFAKMKNSKKILYFADYSNEYLDNLILSTGLCGLHCKDSTLEFIWNTINSEYFEIKKDSLAHGATQQAVNNDDLVSIPLLIPPSDIILKFHNKTKSLYYQKYINELEVQKLIELREFLLPMLMNGQISVVAE